MAEELASLPCPLVPPDPAREELDGLVDLVLELRVHVGDLAECRDAQRVELLLDERAGRGRCAGPSIVDGWRSGSAI